MSRFAVGILAGVGLTLAVTYAAPNLLYERHSVYVASADAARRYTSDGWIVVRNLDGILTIERPRLRLP